MDKSNNKPCVAQVEHETVTLLKQDYDAMVEREQDLIKKIDRWQTHYYRECKRNEYLVQDLADKNKELDKLKKLLSISNLENLQVENMLLKGKAKDKIQFAINELEKVKTYIFEHKVMPFFEERYIVYAKSLNNQIIQQIENLQKEQSNHEN